MLEIQSIGVELRNSRSGDHDASWVASLDDIKSQVEGFAECLIWVSLVIAIVLRSQRCLQLSDDYLVGLRM